jgi:CubicO group peptidase (beta-lactamase class C family)
MTQRCLGRRGFLAGALTCTASACLPSGRFKRRGPVVPEPLDDGWSIATPRSVGLHDADLEQIHEELLREDRQRGALGLLVVKDGKLVWETYLHDGRDRDRYHHIQSMTKSITSLAFSMARDVGHFPRLDLTLRDLIPEALTGKARDKGDITLEQLLTMRSGVAFDNRDFSLEMWVDKPARPLHHILSKPKYAEPGERFYYRDADPQIIGYLLQKELGERESAWTAKKLFEPLGIREYYWEEGPDVSLAAHGLHMKPRDLAKIGQLLLDEGAFRGEQLVSRAWCELAVQPWVPAGDAGTGRERLAYGYYFWVDPARRFYAAWGHGGQHILVCPDQRLVLVKIALPDTDDLAGGTLDEFIDLIEPLLG